MAGIFISHISSTVFLKQFNAENTNHRGCIRSAIFTCQNQPETRWPLLDIFCVQLFWWVIFCSNLFSRTFHLNKIVPSESTRLESCTPIRQPAVSMSMNWLDSIVFFCRCRICCCCSCWSLCTSHPLADPRLFRCTSHLRSEQGVAYAPLLGSFICFWRK